MRHLSLFSGIEAASVAWGPLGWQCAGFAEVDPFPCALLEHYWPDVPNLGDVSRIGQSDVESLGRVDVVVFGFPCQDLSVAGKREGLKRDDGTPTRSGLFFDAMRIVRWAQPRWAVAENVPGLFSSNGGRDFAAVVGEMAGADFDVPEGGWQNTGVAAGARGLVEWCVLDAQWFGVPQRRRRVFLVLDTGNWRDRPPLLFERESLCGHPPPRREAGAGIAGPLTACPPGSRMRCDSSDNEHFVTHALRAEGFDASEDGTGRGTPIVPIAYRTSGNCGVMEQGDKTAALNCNTDPTQQIVVIDMRQASRGVKMTNNRHEGSSGGAPGTGIGEPGDPAPTLADSHTPAIASRMAVRRLTPRECERLQGFPDDYTLIQYRGKPAADGPRYRALGNSMAVPVMAWLGRRIMEVDRLENTDACDDLSD